MFYFKPHSHEEGQVGALFFFFFLFSFFLCLPVCQTKFFFCRGKKGVLHVHSNHHYYSFFLLFYMNTLSLSYNIIKKKRMKNVHLFSTLKRMQAGFGALLLQGVRTVGSTVILFLSFNVKHSNHTYWQRKWAHTEADFWYNSGRK